MEGLLKSRIEKDKEFVEEIAVIGPVGDDEATTELLHAKDNILVYHTSKDAVDDIGIKVSGDDDINGLLGLDLLLEAGFTIDLKELRMYL